MSRARVALLLGALATGGLGIHHVTSGPFDRSVPAGQYPSCIAIDETSRRAFVVNSADSTVSVLDAENGDLLRTVRVGLGPVSAVADAITRHAFVLDSGSSAVSVLDAMSGMLVGTITLDGSPELASVDERTGHVFVSVKSPPALWMLDGRSGAVLHRATLPDEATALATDAATGRIFVGTWSGLLLGDTRTGTLLRALNGSAYPLALTVNAGLRHVFVLDGSDGSVAMLDGRTGALLAQAAFGTAAIAIASAASTGRVFVAREGNNAAGVGAGSVALLDAASGRLIRNMPIAGSPIALAVDEHDRRIFVDTGNAVNVLDARSGRLLRAIDDSGARITNEAMAVDGPTGRAFVLDTYDPAADTAGPLARFLRRWLPGLAPSKPPDHGSVHIVDATQ